MVAALALAGSASAADRWHPVPQSCISASGNSGACTVGTAAGGLWKVAVAPGGVHAYGIAHDPSVSILIFNRDPATGKLTQRGCLSADGAGGACTPALNFGNPNGIVVSQDGANVYVSSGASLTVFDRNRSTGALTQKPGNTGCFTVDGNYPPGAGNPANCTRARGYYGPLSNGPSNLVISPDGRQIYTGAGSIVTLMRDPATGALSQPAGADGCITANGADGCAIGRGFSHGRQFAISPDGRSIYAPSYIGNTLMVFDRDPGSGVIRQKDGAAGCIGATVGCAPDPHARLVQPLAVTVSPDSRHVYVSVSNGMLVFARNGDGNLFFQSCVNDGGTAGCSFGRNLSTVSYSDVSPDGQTVVAGLETRPGVVMFAREADGNLSQPPWGDGCATPGGAALIAGASVPGQCVAYPSLTGNGQVTFVDDSSFITGSHTGSSVTAFRRDFYPQCRSQSLTLTQNLAAPLPLTCSDRNGDALRYAIIANPIAGALGAIDEGNARVFYNPFSGYLGKDTVRYRATSTGLTSEDATLALEVVPPVQPPPPTVRPRTVNAPVSYNWAVRSTRHTLTRLIVRNLPLDSTVTLTCTGKPRCVLKRLTIKRSRKSTMNVLNAKALNGKYKRRTRFRSGQTVDIRIAAPSMNTKVLRFKLRKGKVAKHRTYCVPLGAKRAQRGTCS
ncbi:lactonase family protein [Solirubrobacter deserti]|nr:hypothetical protein [Solirubrobacter deserti]